LVWGDDRDRYIEVMVLSCRWRHVIGS
jgi:hypothetical protein